MTKELRTLESKRKYEEDLTHFQPAQRRYPSLQANYIQTCGMGMVSGLLTCRRRGGKGKGEEEGEEDASLLLHFLLLELFSHFFLGKFFGKMEINFQ